jgi:superfamily II DNA or RNA helicase
MELNIDTLQLDKLSGEDFEKVIGELLKHQGFTSLEFTPKTFDFGADILAEKDNTKFAIQIKRSMSPVGIAAVQEVLGGMVYYGAAKGIVITNALFSSSAVELANRASIRLVDRKETKKWLQSAKISSPEVITPFPHQKDVLQNLSFLRRSGETRALAVMASGLGKTYVSALDARSFQSHFEKPIRVLYLSHQGIILEQAMKSFRNVFGNDRSYGRFDGEVHQQDSDLVFATFQSVHRALNLFDPFSFEYVIIDEAHHTAAPSRDEVVAYFRPRFMLGLTATPMRGDGKDIYTYYNDTVAVSLPLERAIADDLLTQIDYRVLSDRIDPTALPQVLKFLGRARKELIFDPRSDRDIVEIIEQEATNLSESPKVIVFCASLNQMDHFAELFHNCRTISGRDDRKTQIATIEAFSAGEFPILLARDVLNEGIDVPDANVLAFLRNTESPVVFLQQLGRGLRKAPNKDKVLVLDFVSNIDRFDFVYSFFSRLKVECSTRRPRKETTDEPSSSLTLDQTARDIISALISKKEEGGFIVEVSALAGSFDYKINVATIKHLVEIGRLIPDFSYKDGRDRQKDYLEKPSLLRFLRQVQSTRPLEDLIPEREFARRIGKTVKWIHQQEKHGRLQPSWIHRRPNGQVEFYFTEQDIENASVR